ncbi:hypothetical protein IJ579_05010 [bacterium]|nr:hypothetical protein [bacterium]
MKNILKNIRNLFILKKREKISRDLKKISEQNLSVSNGAKLTINAEKQKKIDQVKENITAIVKTTKCEPEALINYITAAKTPVYRISNPNKVLSFIGEEEGLICEQKGLFAIYLSILTGQGVKFKTEPMFVIRKTNDINKSYLLHNFYRWYSLKSGLEGFDYESRRKMKIYWFDNSLEATRRLSIESINQIQEAISREREANLFVLDYEKQIEGSKKVLEKIKNEGGADV